MDRTALRELAVEAVAFLPDVAGLLRGVLRDERVPRRAKWEAGLALGYLVVPIDVVPDVLPGIGRLDDLAIVGWALRRLVEAAGEDVVRDHWRGTDRALEVLLRTVHAGFNPVRLLRVAAFRADRT